MHDYCYLVYNMYIIVQHIYISMDMHVYLYCACMLSELKVLHCIIMTRRVQASRRVLLSLPIKDQGWLVFTWPKLLRQESDASLPGKGRSLTAAAWWICCRGLNARECSWWEQTSASLITAHGDFLPLFHVFSKTCCKLPKYSLEVG